MGVAFDTLENRSAGRNTAPGIPKHRANAAIWRALNVVFGTDEHYTRAVIPSAARDLLDRSNSRFLAALGMTPITDRCAYSSGTISSATMLMILISGFTAGPAVSW